MTIEELANKIDLTILNPLATAADVERLAKKALVYPFAGLCVAPCHALLAAKLLKDSPIKVSTVAGFPLGFETTEEKVLAVRRAFGDGAAEVDMVMNQSAFHGGEYTLVEDEIRAVVSAVPGALVKVIIETCYLTGEQKARAVEIIIKAKARFIKTSTGFAGEGALVEDVRLLTELAANRAGVKASGGIKTLAHAMAMLKAGAERLGTSSGIEIVEAFKEGRPA
ncbi:MAG: deoxyribose-phosphate aldolase [Thermodesulfobacteriota bacterium]